MRKAIAILGFLLAVTSLSPVPGQISPGELTRAHSNLEGISNCKKCHDIGKKVSSAKCLECHVEINRLQTTRKGYHNSPEVVGKECFSCHSEHNGRNFSIIHFDSIGFKHSLAGYELVGKHSKINCSDCHKPALVKDKISQLKKGKSYLGLRQDCLSCHKDYHQGTLPSNCAKCHNNNAFKPAEKFSHANTKYPLRGKHADVDCIKCHKLTERNGEKFQEFAGVRFQNCTDCHRDPHESRFGTDCRKCHSEESFHSIPAIKTFDHSKTNYPLEGKHVYLDCKTCHKQAYTVKIKHDKCTDCHKDYHKDQFKKTGSSPECSECHTLKGFTPSGFTIERHNQSVFVLDGAHLATPCISCHKKTGEWNFRLPSHKCIDCHENIHGKLISEKYMPLNDCKTCHSTQIWSAIRFDHKKTSFELSGKHATLSCRNCHFPQAPGEAPKQRFAGMKQDCLSCHKDEHQGQFPQDQSPYCAKCHTYDNWKISRFNHDNTRYKLDGKHVNVECGKCHPRIAGEKPYTLYKTNKLLCKDCHS